MRREHTSTQAQAALDTWRTTIPWVPVRENVNPLQAARWQTRGRGEASATHAQLVHQNLPTRWIIPPPPGRNDCKCVEEKGSLEKGGSDDPTRPPQFEERRDTHLQQIRKITSCFGKWLWNSGVSQSWVPGLPRHLVVVWLQIDYL